MADTKIVGGGSAGGKGSKKDPFKAIGAPIIPPYPSTPVVVTIYARADGDDKCGDGSLDEPYASFQRAIRDVPHVIPQNTKYVVDVTGIGTESFPSYYEMPAIHGTALNVDAPIPFPTGSALDIRAFPQPASNVPIADTTIPVADVASIAPSPGTGLAIITTSTFRASWGGDSLKGKFLISAVDADTSCVIYGSDATHLYVCNLPSQVAASDLFVVEPSTIFETQTVNGDEGGFNSIDVSTICFQGIGFVCLDPDSFSSSFQIAGADQSFVCLCDFEGIGALFAPIDISARACVFRNKTVYTSATAFVPSLSLFLDCDFYEGEGPAAAFRQCVFDGNKSFLGPAPFATTASALITPVWEFLNILIKGSLAPDAAILARGSGFWSMEAVQIDGSAGDAIRVEGLVAMDLTAVVGSGNAGLGISVNDGASVRIRDDATIINGTIVGNDMKVGTLPPRAWADFRGAPPIKNEYDIREPFVMGTSGVLQPVGDEAPGLAGTGGPSGSRLFQRA